MGNSAAVAATRAAVTVAAPHMSNFISSIDPDGLMLMPPVSKVTPLPIRTMGASSGAPPRYCATISLPGVLLPRVTDMKAPHAEFLDPFFLQHLDGDSVPVGKLADFVREVGGVAHVGWRVGEIAGQGQTVVEGLTVFDRQRRAGAGAGLREHADA